jgi:hypothetical protein
MMVQFDARRGEEEHDFWLGDLCDDLKEELLKETDYSPSLGGLGDRWWEGWLKGVGFDLCNANDAEFHRLSMILKTVSFASGRGMGSLISRPNDRARMFKEMLGAKHLDEAKDLLDCGFPSATKEAQSFTSTCCETRTSRS